MFVTGVEHQVHTFPDKPLGLWIELARRIRIRDLLDADEHIHGRVSPL